MTNPDVNTPVVSETVPGLPWLVDSNAAMPQRICQLQSHLIHIAVLGESRPDAGQRELGESWGWEAVGGGGVVSCLRSY